MKRFLPGRRIVSILLQIERGGVDAIAHPGGPRPIVKDVPQVGVATAALHFRPPHPVTCIRLCLDSFFAGRSIETGPPRARMKLCFVTKQGLTAANALIRSGGFRVLVFASERRLGSLLPRHIVLILRKLLLPSDVVLAYLFFHCSLPVGFLSDAYCD